MATTDASWSNETIVSAAWLTTHTAESGVRVVDVRSLPQYHAGHIPGALHSGLAAIKLTTSAPDAIAAFEHQVADELRHLGLQPGERVVFYEDIAGTAAARAVWLLDYAGHGGGAMLDGGLVAWIDAGGAISRAPVQVAPSATTFTFDRSVLATADDILTRLAPGASPAVLLDTRADQEYAESTIPGSRHVEWVNHLTPRGAFRSPAELRALYADHGFALPSATSVITFCASGYRAAHSYVVLRALGQPRVANYAPSWGEWGNRTDLPKEQPLA